MSVDHFLQGSHIGREIPIFGAPFGQDVFIVGLIDEIKFDFDNFTLDIFELKTRSSKSLPSKSQKDSHKLQVMLYKKLFDDLVLGNIDSDLIAKHLSVDLENQLGDDVRKEIKKSGFECDTLLELLKYMFEKLQNVTCINQLVLEYCYQDDHSTISFEEVQYDEAWLKEKFLSGICLWKGEREATGVDIEDAWKCRTCEYIDICEWRIKKAAECQERKTSAK